VALIHRKLFGKPWCKNVISWGLYPQIDGRSPDSIMNFAIFPSKAKPTSTEVCESSDIGNLMFVAGFIENVYSFDREFFNLTPSDVTHMNPMQRLLLECSWEALENANIRPSKLRGKQVGVFIAAGNGDGWLEFVNNSSKDYSKLYEHIRAHSGVGSEISALSGRISYFHDWRGPVATISTASSSSLAALNFACQSLLSGECEYALVGGCVAHFTPQIFVMIDKARMASPTGRCASYSPHGKRTTVNWRFTS
jgi:phthiocerol/phenolphthiocerol synthesis type-I polyketide synthase C